MRRLTVGAAITTVAAALIASVGLVAPAQALSAGVDFSADGLPTWQTNGTVYATQAIGDKVLVGGNFTQVRPPEGQSGTTLNQQGLVVLDADSGAPVSCQFSVPGQVRAITLSADGTTAYIGGSFTRVNSVVTSRVAALNLANCTVSSSFISTGIGSMVYSLSATSSSIYAGGMFTAAGGQSRSGFVALNAATGAVLPWVADITSNDVRGVSEWGGNWDTEPPLNGGFASVVSPDGRYVVLGGDFDLVNGVDSHAMVVVDATTGAVVKNFPMNSPFRNTSRIRGLSSDATQFYTGNEGTGGGQFDGRSAWRWSNFTNVYMDTCLGATQAVLAYNGTLYSASHAHNCNSVNQFGNDKRNYFLAERTDSPQQLGWYPQANDGIGEGIGPRALTVATGASGVKYLYSGGDFTRIGGVAQQGITRFSSQDSGAIPAPQVAAATNANGQIEVRFRASVDPDDSTLTYRIYRDGSTTPMWTGSAYSVWWNRPQLSVVDTTAAPGSRHTYRVTASDPVATSVLSSTVTATASGGDAYGSAVLTDTPAVFWRYDETSGTWAQDASQNSVNGTSGRYDGATPVAGGAAASGSVANFDGTDDYIAGEQFIQRPDVFTVETWFKTTTTSGGKLVGFGNGRPRTDTNAYQNSGNYDNHVYMGNDGRINFGVYANGGSVLTSPTPLNDGQWHLVTASMGAAGMSLSIDGVRVGSNNVTRGDSYMGIWKVGGDTVSGWKNQPSSRFFAGQLDDTAIYSQQLTAKQVLTHYNASGRTAAVTPAPTDAYGAAVYTDDPSLYWRFDETSGSAKDSSMMSANPGTVLSGVQRGRTGAFGGSSAYALTGANNSLVVSPSTAPTNAFTVEAWVQTTSSRGGKILGFENTSDGNGSAYDKHLYMNDAGQVLFGTYSGSAVVIRSNTRVNNGTWHHIVGTQGPEGMRLYVDGQLQGSNTATGHDTNTGYWRVGGGNLSSWPDQPLRDRFTGTVDEVAVYASALTETQVARRFAVAAGDSTAPTTPGSLTAAPEGAGVKLTWTASTDNRGVTGYRVYRGATADFALSDAALVTTTTSTSYTDASASTASPYYAVTAIDAAGNESAAARVSASVPDTTAPTVPSTLTASANGSTVTLGWTASTDDVGVASYEVFRGTDAQFTATSSSRIGTSTSAAYTDASAPVGRLYYRVVAVDAAGNRSAASSAATVDVADPSATPVTVQVRPSADTMVAQVAPNTVYGAGNQISARGGSSPIESYLAFSLPAAPSGRTLTGATLQLRTSNDSSAASTDAQSISLLNGTWSESSTTWANRSVTVGTRVGQLASVPSTTTTYTVQLDAAALASAAAQGTLQLAITSTGSDNSRFFSKDQSRTDWAPLLTLTYGSSGSGGGTAPTDPGTPSEPEPEPAPDTTAPSTPGALVGSLSNGAPQLSWSASTDDVAVTGYTVHRSSTAGFTPDASNRIATVTSTSYRDAAATSPGTYYYAVVATDAAGNRSAAATTSATVPQPSAQPVVVNVVARQDTMVASTNASYVYGALNQISTRGNTAIESYLQFEIPTAPAGTQLSSASLNLRTSTDSTAGSTDAQTVRLLDGAWSEAATTWANKTTTPGAAIGQIGSVPAVNTAYSVALDAQTLASSTGLLSLALTATGTDNARFWSKDQANAASAPTLVLTYLPVASASSTSASTTSSSASSAQASSTQARSATSGASTSSVTVDVSGDTFAAQAEPATVQGTSTTLVSRGGSSPAESFLSFALPAAPAGATLTGATLQFRTTDDAAAGSVDEHAVSLLTGAFDETTLVWTNRPTQVDSLLGRITGATAPGTAYSAPLDVAKLAGKLGSTVTFSLTSAGSDDLKLWSREANTGRPVLVLTYAQ